MSGFVEGIDRSQRTLFPAVLDDYVAEDNPVRAVDAFVEGLDLGELGFGRVTSLEQGRPSYHPATLLKIYIYGYLNRVPSSRRLERECQRNIELVWLTGQLAPDFKTIADFRKDNGKPCVASHDDHPEKMTMRRQTAEHPFGTIKDWMGGTHFLTRRLPKVATEMALNVLAYNTKRVMAIIGVVELLARPIHRTYLSCSPAG